MHAEYATVTPPLLGELEPLADGTEVDVVDPVPTTPGDVAPPPQAANARAEPVKIAVMENARRPLIHHPFETMSAVLVISFSSSWETLPG
jgi:hypothetical protein